MWCAVQWVFLGHTRLFIPKSFARGPASRLCRIESGRSDSVSGKQTCISGLLALRGELRHVRLCGMLGAELVPCPALHAQWGLVRVSRVPASVLGFG